MSNLNHWERAVKCTHTISLGSSVVEHRIEAAGVDSSILSPSTSGLLAQLDRASVYETEGRKFESCRDHHNF